MMIDHDIMWQLCVARLQILIWLDLLATPMTNDFNGILIITTASLCQNDDLIFELSLFEGAGEGEDIFIEI